LDKSITINDQKTMNKTFRFGIIGPGKIATKFCESLKTISHEAQVYAVASRVSNRAKDFAATFNAPKFFSSYEELVKDQAVDIVYIATPHPFHFEQTQLCLNHGKAVLCEKPLTIGYAQTSQLVELARSKKVFLMEAMWSRFIPALVKMKSLIDKGEIGDIKFMHADFGFVAPHDLEMRTFNKSLGGGAQLDVGVYPMFLTLWLLGKPDYIKAFANLASTGADENTAALFGYKSGATASIYSSFMADSPKEAVITGTKGTITVHAAWHKAMSFSLKKNDMDKEEVIEIPYQSNGLQFQAVEAIQCLREGRTESSKLSLDMSLMMAEVADEIKKQIGVRYVGE
jgi:predicted dehydrogenase